MADQRVSQTPEGDVGVPFSYSRWHQAFCCPEGIRGGRQSRRDNSREASDRTTRATAQI